MVDEKYLRAMHDLLPIMLKLEGIGPAYAKMLRSKRQEVHPAGVEKIRTIQTPSGLNIDVNLGDRLGCDLFYGFFQERIEFELLMSMIRPGNTVIDVGANVGLYALEACLRASGSGKVMAFEPDPRSFALLAKNVKCNSMSSHLKTEAICVGSADGETAFNLTEEPSLSGMGLSARSNVKETISVPMRSLDSLLSETGYRHVDVIKIDVEGFEADVIQGACETLANSDAVVMFEASSKNLKSSDWEKLGKVLVDLSRKSYRLFALLLDQMTLLRFESLDSFLSRENRHNDSILFLARGDTDAAFRLETAARQVFQRLQNQQEDYSGIARDSGIRCGENPVSGATVDLRALEDAFQFVVKWFSENHPGRSAYENALRNMTGDLEKAKAGKIAYREKSEKAEAGKIAYREKLEKAKAGKMAYREKLETAAFEFTRLKEIAWEKWKRNLPLPAAVCWVGWSD